jgi:hypothetical protein
MVAAAIAVGSGQSARAAEACPPLGSATITPPSGAVTAGSSVHVSAQISGLMLLKAHLQISGPGLDQHVGNSVMSGKIEGDVTVPKAGYFTLAVIGNGTKCAYKTEGFSAKERPAAPKPTHGASPSRTPGAAAGGKGTSSGAGSLPTGGAGNGANPALGLNPLNGASPFSLPSVAPDGSGLGFAYPSPEPEVASPASQPVARNVSQTTPVKWGQSLAIALVLLLISAHLGMWSRRQRLAAEGAGAAGAGTRPGRGKGRKDTTVMAATGVLTRPEADEAKADGDGTATARNGAPTAGDGATTTRDGATAVEDTPMAEDRQASTGRAASGESALDDSAEAGVPTGVPGSAGAPGTGRGGDDGQTSGRRGSRRSDQSYRGRRRRD